MKWVAKCERCGAKYVVPGGYIPWPEAKQWASDWRKEHMREEHSDNSNTETSTQSS